MIPGPTTIKKCSDCSGLIKENSMLSGNTVDAKYWTDGKGYAPMLPDWFWLVKCPHCHNLLWINELEKITEVEPWEDYKDSKYYNKPELKDYFTKLDSNNLSNEKILYIRLHAWWLGNNVRRRNDDNWFIQAWLRIKREEWEKLPDESSKKLELSKEIESLLSPKEIPILSDEERNNLQMLYDMLNSSDYDLLMKAEIRRELGQFEDAEDIIKHRYDKKYSKHWFIIKKLVEERDPYLKHFSFIKKLVEKRDPNVAEIKFED